jgi:hypothetical protein
MIEYLTRAPYARRTTTPLLSQSVRRRGMATAELDANKGDRERVVILGSGWAGLLSPVSVHLTIMPQLNVFVRNTRLRLVPQTQSEEIPDFSRFPGRTLCSPPPQLNRSRHARIPHGARTGPRQTPQVHFFQAWRMMSTLQQDCQSRGECGKPACDEGDCRKFECEREQRRGGDGVKDEED